MDRTSTGSAASLVATDPVGPGGQAGPFAFELDDYLFELTLDDITPVVDETQGPPGYKRVRLTTLGTVVNRTPGKELPLFSGTVAVALGVRSEAAMCFPSDAGEVVDGWLFCTLTTFPEAPGDGELVRWPIAPDGSLGPTDGTRVRSLNDAYLDVEADTDVGELLLQIRVATFPAQEHYVELDGTPVSVPLP